MGVEATSVDAGKFADQRFRARRRAWWRRVWWIFPTLAVFEVAVCVGPGLLLQPEHMGFFWGLGLGLAAAMVMVLADSPPHHIERWRQGADGEKATARALQRVVADGWLLINDIDIGRGNVDHVLVGRPACSCSTPRTSTACCRSAPACFQSAGEKTPRMDTRTANSRRG